MIDRLMRIASFLEADGRFDMADQIDDVLVKIAVKEDLNDFSSIVTQAKGQLMPQYNMVEYSDPTKSYRGQGLQQALYLPDIVRSPQYQALKRRALAPIDFNLSPQERDAAMRDKYQAQQQMSNLVASMYGQHIQSTLQYPYMGRGVDLTRQQLQYQARNMGQSVLTDPYQTGWYQGYAPSFYQVAPQVMQPWVAPQSIPYYAGQPQIQSTPFAQP